MVLVRRDIGHNVFDVAAEDAAEVIDCGGCDRLILSELINGGAGDVMILDQGIGRFLGRGKGFPKRIVNDHLCTSLPAVRNLCMRYDKRNFLLDYSRYNDYNGDRWIPTIVCGMKQKMRRT